MTTPSISIFRPGSHYPQLDAGSLARTVAAYDPAKHEAPLVIGHPADDRPAYGWVQSLAFSEGLLKATPRQVDPALSDRVEAGRYKKISAGFYHPQAPGNPAPGVYYLRHVGFLGAQPPIVKGLPPVRFSDTAADYITIEFSESDQPWLWRMLSRLLRSQREHLIASTDLETADRVLPDYTIQSLADEAERLAAERHDASVPAFSEPVEEPPMAEPAPPTPDAREAALSEREASLNAREEALARQQAGQSRQETVAFCEQLVTEGRLLPRDRDAMAELVGGLSAETTVTFAEGDSQIPKPGPAAQFLKDYLKRQPVLVDFSERAPATTGAPDDSTPSAGMALPSGYTVDPDQAALHQRVVTFAEKNGVSYDEALTTISRLEG